MFVAFSRRRLCVQLTPSALQLFVGAHVVAIVMTAICFVVARRTSPGTVPAGFKADAATCFERSSKGALRHCQHCQRAKPDRSVHCRQANACVLRFSHWSELLNAPVGFFNFKAYFLMLVYASLAAAVPLGLDCLFAVETWSAGRSADLLGDYRTLASIAVASAVLAAVGQHALLHAVLISNNSTLAQRARQRRYEIPSVEHLPRIARPNPTNPFRQELVASNWEAVLGPNLLTWPFPVNTMVGDGLTFPLGKTLGVANLSLPTV